MIQMNERNVMRTALAATIIILVAATFFLNLIKTTGISRIPVQEIYSQGVALNSIVNFIMPIIMVLAILFILGLATFGLDKSKRTEK
ncbi:hypothetical protein ig2599ANME_1585 [groundwater metagenome]